MSTSNFDSPSQKPLALTKDGARVLATAQAIAISLGQKWLDSYHILLGILESGDSLGLQTLARFAIKLESLKTRLWAYVRLNAKQEQPPQEGNFYGFGLTADGARVMAATVQETEELGLDFIDSRMMILGMLRTADSQAGAILQQFDVRAGLFQERAQFDKSTPSATVQPVRPRRQVLGPSSTVSFSPQISPIFLLLVAVFAALGYMLFKNLGQTGPLTFAFVLIGWILAVSLHEFGHALTAYLSGDESVARMGYLTLDPLKYTHPVMSILFPILFLLMGGIPLPGGAVYINRAAIRERWQLSLVSAAGPLATLLFGLLLLTPFMFGVSNETLMTHAAFFQALALLAFFQIFAFILNLLPWPGLDGFGILEPWLPPSILRYAYMLSGMGIFILFFLFAYTPFGRMVGASVWSVIEAISLDAATSAFLGFKQFFFWK